MAIFTCSLIMKCWQPLTKHVSQLRKVDDIVVSESTSPLHEQRSFYLAHKITHDLFSFTNAARGFFLYFIYLFFFFCLISTWSRWLIHTICKCHRDGMTSRQAGLLLMLPWLLVMKDFIQGGEKKARENLLRKKTSLMVFCFNFAVKM